jgi:hypothetical protein
MTAIAAAPGLIAECSRGIEPERSRMPEGGAAAVRFAIHVNAPGLTRVEVFLSDEDIDAINAARGRAP